MILIDYSGVAIASLFANDLHKEKLDESLLRHMILNTIRMYNVSYREKYGPNVYLACDSSSWRKLKFEYYKAGRKKYRDDTGLDWEMIFESFRKIRDELDEHSPMTVLCAEGAEADDIIGTLTYQTQEFGQNEPVMIISSDKDFLQLQKFSNVAQNSPSRKEEIKANGHEYLLEHIMRGDPGDGVPNVLSDGDTFVTEKRQKPITKKKLKALIESYERHSIHQDFGLEISVNIERNREMVDLEMTPKDVQERILVNKRSQDEKKHSGFMDYLIQKRCSNLIDSINDFYPL